jgi:hypothetical protein
MWDTLWSLLTGEPLERARQRRAEKNETPDAIWPLNNARPAGTELAGLEALEKAIELTAAD